jgi:hypothetical protein
VPQKSPIPNNFNLYNLHLTDAVIDDRQSILSKYSIEQIIDAASETLRQKEEVKPE